MRPMSREGRPGRPARRLALFSGLALSATLVAFHGGLLWQRVLDGSLLEPAVALRWVLSTLLVFALLRLWCLGLPLLRGRSAAVLWLVVLLLHAGGPAAVQPAVEPVTSLVLLTAALAALAVLGAGAVGAAAGSAADARLAARRRGRAGSRPSGWSPTLFSRPPPAPLHP